MTNADFSANVGRLTKDCASVDKSAARLAGKTGRALPRGIYLLVRIDQQPPVNIAVEQRFGALGDQLQANLFMLHGGE